MATTGNGMSDSHAVTATEQPAWVGDVLHFWFEQLSEAQWWAHDEAVDASIRARFLALHEQLVAQDPPSTHAPRTALATVIVLDQFSRNLFRGSPRAYAGDSIARRVASSAIAAGFDRALTNAQRMFLYMPFEHSEDAADQHRSVELFGATGDENWLRHAQEHKAIIDRFGRFPHRNAVLGRISSAEEVAFLGSRSSWF